MALFQATKGNNWTDSGSTYTNLKIYRCGKLRIASGSFSGNHSADEVLWTVDAIDCPVDQMYTFGVGTNKSVAMIMLTSGKLYPTQATTSAHYINFAYEASTEA